METVWRLSGLTATEKLVLLALADHADDEGGNAYPAVRRIAERTGLSSRSIHRALGRLSRKGGEIRRVGKAPTGRADRRPILYSLVPLLNGVTESHRATQSHPVEAARGDRESLTGCQPVTHGVTESHPNHQRTIKEPRKKAPSALDVQIPESLAGNGFAPKWREFLEYRATVRRKPVSASAAKKLLAKLARCPETANQAIDQSIENDWQGLFPEKLSTVRGKAEVPQRQYQDLN